MAMFGSAGTLPACGYLWGTRTGISQAGHYSLRALFCIPRIQHRTEQNLAPALETWGGARKGEIARKVSSLLQR